MPYARPEADNWVFNPELLRIEESEPSVGPYKQIILDTERGEVDLRYYSSQAAESAILMVGGVEGGFDSPAKRLYETLPETLQQEGTAGLRVRFRNPTDLGEAVHDVVAGLRFLTGRGIMRVGLIGHSFGGAVVIMTGAARPEVCTVVTLATQSFGTRMVRDLAPRPILLIHGMRDRVLTPYCSVQVHRQAGEPKELRLFENCGHVFDEESEAVFSTVYSWMRDKLSEVRSVASQR